MDNKLSAMPLSLYIHIPWCIQKCPYCDFNSHAVQNNIPEKKYVQSLLADLKQDIPKINHRPIHSIFIGGGTPSIFSPESLDELLVGIHKHLKIPTDIEITLEANPGTVDNARFQAFRQIGINRLSLGIQSFQDSALKNLKRIHDRKTAINAIETAIKAGFENINLDLMFGLPHQTPENAVNDLRTAMSFQPNHLSWYQLTIEPNTAFYQHPPILPDDDSVWEIQRSGQDFLQTQGYEHYEISAYTKASNYCQHNLNYWQFGDYLGIGAGAHAKITTPEDKIIRFSKRRHPYTYLQLVNTPQVISQTIELNQADICLEFMMNALRLSQGFTEILFQERTGLILSDIDKPLQIAIAQGWLKQNAEVIQPTRQGLQFLNQLLGLFIV